MIPFFFRLHFQSRQACETTCVLHYYCYSNHYSLSLFMLRLSQLSHLHVRLPVSLSLFRLGQCPLKRQRTQPTQQLPIHLQNQTIPAPRTAQKVDHSYLLVVIVPVEGALLFTMFAVHRRPILDFRIGAPLALVAYECCDNVTVLARCGLAVRFHVLLAFFADRAGVALRGLLKFRTTVSALYHRKRSTTFLSKHFG